MVCELYSVQQSKRSLYSYKWEPGHIGQSNFSQWGKYLVIAMGFVNQLWLESHHLLTMSIGAPCNFVS